MDNQEPEIKNFYFSVGKDKKGLQRKKLYYYYIQKNFKNIVVFDDTDQYNQSVYILIKK